MGSVCSCWELCRETSKGGPRPSHLPRHGARSLLRGCGAKFWEQPSHQR